MSLLNDVLKDLDHRATGQDPDVALIQQSSIGAQFAANHNRKKIIGASVVGGLLLIGVVAFFYMRGGAEGSGTPKVVQPSIPVAANPVPSATPADKPDSADVAPETARAFAEPVAQPVKSEQPIASTPRVARMSKAAAPAPSSSVEFVAESESVTVKPVAMAPQVTSSYTAPVVKRAPAPSRQELSRPSPVHSSRPVPSRNTIAPASRAPLPRTYNSSVAISKARIRGLHERDVAARAVAQEAMQVGDFERAEYGLRQFLTANPDAELSRSTLASLLLQRGRGEEAERILIGGFGHDEEGLGRVKLLARAQVERGDLESAIRVLDANPVPIEQDPEYHALKAAIYQRADRHDVAARTYQNLLREYPPQAAWWVGLGISLEATARRKDAIHAYRQARDFHDAPKALKSYSAQRILALAR